MTGWTFIRRSAWFYRRTGAAVAVGAALATTVLTGALLVGDGLRQTLAWMATARLGQVQLALRAPRASLGGEVVEALAGETGLPVAGVLQYRGMVRRQGDGRQANGVQINGVDYDFWAVGGVADPLAGLGDGVAVNSHLARKLHLQVGDVVIVRLPRPSALSMDMPLGTPADQTVLFSRTVEAIVDDRQFGRFSLHASQLPALNLFMPLEHLAGYTEAETQPAQRSGRCNLLLVGGAGRREVSVQDVQGVLKRMFDPAMAGYHLSRSEGGGPWRLTTGRVFFDPPVVRAMQVHGPPGDVVLTYLANELRIGRRAAPYAMVCAYGDVHRPDFCRPLNRTIGPDQVLLNRWLADDLQAKVGDRLTMKYYVVEAGRRVVERSCQLTVAGIVPMEGLGADPDLMPAFPGISDSQDINDWEPGIPIDLSKIRDLDERYWDQYRGAPKAFVNLDTGRRLWGNRWGDVTQMRFDAGAGRQVVDAVNKVFAEHLGPEAFGLVFQPVRTQALRAAAEGQDFGGLFIGLSFFIIFAALLLTGLMFVFGIEQRAGQIGTLLALGFTPRRVGALLMGEGGLLAVLGTAAGLLGAVGYARLTMGLLGGVWRGAVGTSELVMAVEPGTLGLGAGVGLVMACGAMGMALRRQLKRTPRQLLAGPADLTGLSGGGRWPGLAAGACLLGAAGLAMTAGGGAEGRVMAFFGAGTLVLAGGLLAQRAAWGRLAGRLSDVRLDLRRMGRLNCARRAGRSLAVVAMLGGGLFVLLSVCANTRRPPVRPDQRAAPTGGFELYAESALPVYRDLNTEDGRSYFGLEGGAMAGVHVVPMRLREGDPASCLNLNRPQQPRLLGVPVAEMRRLDPFTVCLAGPDPQGSAWDALLAEQDQSDVVPGFVDAGTAQWILKKQLGQDIEYLDDRGRPFKVRLVGWLNDTVLQGSVVIAERHWVQRFPDSGGWRVFLVDVPAGRVGPVKRLLGDRLADVGLDVVSTTDRLAMFNQVQNTYLSIFAALGGLGMVLGSIGLGVVVARNLYERRGELAVMGAIGFDRQQIGRMLHAEYDLLVASGVGWAVAATMVAMVPVWLEGPASVPWGLWGGLTAAVAGSGVMWIRLAGHAVTGRSLLAALREE